MHKIYHPTHTAKQRIAGKNRSTGNAKDLMRDLMEERSRPPPPRTTHLRPEIPTPPIFSSFVILSIKDLDFRVLLLIRAWGKAFKHSEAPLNAFTDCYRKLRKQGTLISPTARKPSGGSPDDVVFGNQVLYSRRNVRKMQ